MIRGVPSNAQSQTSSMIRDRVRTSPWWRKEVLEQGELAARHRNGLASNVDFTGRRVESEVARREDIRPLRRPAARERPQPGEQLGEGERLDR